MVPPAPGAHRSGMERPYEHDIKPWGDVSPPSKGSGGVGRPASWGGPDPRALYRMAERQHGLFTLEQARAAGYGSSLVAYHARRGRFRRVARALYRLVDFPRDQRVHMVQAWLEAGGERTDAVLTHRSALALHGLLDPPTGRTHGGTVDVTVPRSARWLRVSPWVTLRTAKEPIPPEERDQVDGFPVTALIRSVLDATQHRAIGFSELGLVLRRIRYRDLAIPLEVKVAARERSRSVGHVVTRAFRTVPSTFRGPERPARP